MDPEEDRARRLLGIPPGARGDAARAAYRRLVKRHHPDVSDEEGAERRTAELTAAYRLVRAREQVRGREQVRAQEHVPTPEPPPAAAARLLADDVIGLDTPLREALMLVLDAAHELGEVSYLDPSSGLVEVVVEFLQAPTSSVVLSLHATPGGHTAVACEVEPLSGGSAPPAAAVTQLVLETLRGRADAPRGSA